MPKSARFGLILFLLGVLMLLLLLQHKRVTADLRGRIRLLRAANDTLQTIAKERRTNGHHPDEEWVIDA
jgi:Tfp pilus assembly protein PilX